MDCGIHPGLSGMMGLPFFDDDTYDPEDIDLILITHFHLDHCAALPYFLKTTKFKGRVFMTHPTKSIYKLIMPDYVKVLNKDRRSGDDSVRLSLTFFESSFRVLHWSDSS